MKLTSRFMGQTISQIVLGSLGRTVSRLFENASETAFIFVTVVVVLVIGYGVAKMIWGED